MDTAVTLPGGQALSRARRVASIRAVSPEELTDGELIERVGDGDREAFEELYRRYTRPVLGLALRRLGDRGRAEDALQDAFAAIWRSAASYDSARGQGGAWLYTVATRTCLDVAESRGRRALPVDLGPSSAHAVVGDVPSSDVAVTRRQLGRSSGRTVSE